MEKKKVRITSGIFWTLMGKHLIMEKSDAGAACLSWTFFFSIILSVTIYIYNSEFSDFSGVARIFLNFLVGRIFMNFLGGGQHFLNFLEEPEFSEFSGGARFLNFLNFLNFPNFLDFLIFLNFLNVPNFLIFLKFSEFFEFYKFSKVSEFSENFLRNRHTCLLLLRNEKTIVTYFDLF